MAHVLVVDPDVRIRRSLVRMLQGLGHVVDEADAAEEKTSSLAGFALVFAAAGPGGSAIDPTMGTWAAVSPEPKVVWTGPVAGTIQPAVQAGVGVDVLELPARLPALNALLARHLPRLRVDRWAGEAFLRQVDGPSTRFPPVRVLFLLHRLAGSGTLIVGSRQIDVKQGRIADARGFAEVGAGGGLMHAIGSAIGAGVAPDQAMQQVGVDLFVALLQSSRAEVDVRFAAGDPPAPFALQTAIPRLIALAVDKVYPADEIRRNLAGRPSRRLSIHVPDDAPDSVWGLSPGALKVVRGASRVRDLGGLVASAGGAERDSVWTAIAFLQQLGILRFDDEETQVEETETAAPGVEDDIVIEAVHTEPRDPRVAALQERLAAFQALPPWELFGIGEPADVTVDFVAKRFRELAAEFHPDRFVQESDEVKDAAEACFSYLGDMQDRFDSEAFRAETRERIVAKREGRTYVTDAERKKARAAFVRGEHAARRKDWQAALVEFETSVTADPTSWEAAMHLAVARLRAEKATAAQTVEALRPLVADTRPGKAELAYQLGEALLAMGDEAGAGKAFAEAVEQFPGHVGAGRRVRMQERRQGKAADDTKGGKGGGLLGGLFSWGKGKS